MKPILFSGKKAATFLLLLFSVAAVFVLNSCECLSTDERFDFLVFAGNRNDCRTLMEQNQGTSQDITYICPGEQVTLCWTSSDIKEVQLTVGGQTETVSLSGSKVITIPATTTITLHPVGAKCVHDKNFTVNVVSSPTPSSWDGRWDLSCSKISFEISDAFISKKIMAKDITPNWCPVVTITDDAGNVSNVLCTTPPFLLGQQQEEGFGFNLNDPLVTVAFSRPLRAVGHWNFTWKARCPQQDSYKCNNLAVFPFDITLICP